MSRTELEKLYEVSADGLIESPGKFEGGLLYVPYFWEQGLDGGSDEDRELFSDEDRELFSDEDRELFPELGDTYGLSLSEDSNGLVYVNEYADVAEYGVARSSASLEDDYSEESDADSVCNDGND